MKPRALWLTLLLPLVFPAFSTRVPAAPPPATLRMVSHNVWNGFTEKPEPRLDQWRAWMIARDADVVALQELNGFTAQQLEDLAQSWGHSHSALLKEDGFPTALTSRTPITEVRRVREGMHHGLLHGKIRGIHFYVIHFHPGHYLRRIEEAERLKQDIASIRESNPRVVLIGDFNGFSPVDQPHYAADTELVSFFMMLDRQNPNSRNLNDGQIDYGGITAILDAGYVDLVAQFRPSTAPFFGSFPTELRREEDLGNDRRIDYIFVSSNLAGSARYAAILRDPTTALISDHYPLVAELDIR